MVRVYKDIFTGHELASDSYPAERKFEGAGIFIKSQFVEVTDDCGIPDNDEDGGTASGPTRVNNIAHSFNLSATTYKKSEFIVWVKSYIKKLLEKVGEAAPEKLDAFKKNSQDLVKHIIARFDQCEFYINSDMDEAGMVIAAEWADETKDADEGPTFIIFADGIKEEKY